MLKAIAIANQKGGVGKTTTAINLAASLAVAERSTLLIDIDPQSNATVGVGIDRRELQANIYHALIGEQALEDLLHPTELAFLSVIPATPDLTGAEVELVSALSRETRLKNAVERLNQNFEYLIIDCPPSLGLLTINALCAAHTLLIPLQCEYYAMEGLTQLMHTIELVRTHLNHSLAIEGILLTMFDRRNNLCHQVAREVRDYFPKLVFETVIPRNVRLGEAPSFGKPMVLYDIMSRGSQAYLALARELMEGK